MRVIAPLTLLLATAAATPKPGHKLIPREILAGMTVAQAQSTCGNNQDISCCNKAVGSDSDGDNDKGLLGGLLGGLLNGVLGGLLGDGLLGQCGKLDLSVIGVTGLLNDQCKGNVACCDSNTSPSLGGSLINIQLPCLAIGSLL